MKKLLAFGLILVASLLASCGGSDNTLLNPGGTTTTSAASINLFTSSPQLPSDNTGQETVTLTALVLDQNGTTLEGIPVTFSKPQTDPAFITVTDPQTGPTGAQAELSNGIGSPQNRTVTVTATAPTTAGGTVSASVTVDVTGTDISVTGPEALAQGDTGDYVAVLTDSKGIGVPGQVLTIDSALGNTVSAASMTTDTTGKVDFQVTAAQGGQDTLTIGGLGISKAKPLNISNDTFAFTSPAANAELVLSATADVPITVNWTVGGVPQVGQQINFARTRGSLSSTQGAITPATSAVTDANGNATLFIGSTNAGSALLTASIAASGTTTTRTIEFISVNPSTLNLQANKFTVPVNEQTEIIATVRDVDFNFVKNQTVNFILINDITGGSLNPASAVTGSDGQASAFYTAGSVSGPANGVEIRAEVASTAPAVTDTVFLTVASKELDLVIGTGNDIFEPTTATFAEEWDVIVTDSVGNAVDNKDVQVAIRSINYLKGRLVAGQSQWAKVDPLATCPDEDINRNGILDPGEDGNGSGQIEAGNVAVVAAVPLSASATDPCASAGATGTSAQVTTNAQGIARVCVFWPQDHSWWVDAQIEAQAGVAGSEFSAQQVFNLPALASDINNIAAAPPNVISPYGVPAVNGDCSEPPPGLP